MSDEAMPHMSVREGKICGVPTRLFRMSFTGERGFEVNVPADYGQAVWEALWAEGQKHGACAYGTEAMHVLRAEKGYIIVGQDTDGTVTPNDAGLDWAVGKKKTDFVGIRGLMRPDLVADGPQAAGRPEDQGPEDRCWKRARRSSPIPKQPIPMKMIGHVTSSYWSENCGRSHRAGAGRRRPRRAWAQTLYVPMPDGVDRGGGHRHGVLRREGGAPQWLRLPRRRQPPSPRATPRLPAASFRPRASSSPCCRRPSAYRCARRPLRSRRCPRRSASTLPQKPKSSASKAGRTALWLGPDEWLVIDEAGKDPLADCAGVKALHSAVGISHRNVAHRRHRPGGRGDGQCRLSAGPVARRFPGRRCSRTVLGKVEIVLLRTGEDAFRVECWRSFSDYVFTFLTEGARQPPEEAGVSG